ncbi:hypothetical protein ACL9RF_05320 [Sphingobacterium sp. Mn56C]|uniref:hypothetical protein n=1 Tax=Sphingobacterium sp. Mn56C TaxID=3395261 RepID=UPI003BEBA813
MMRYSFPRYAFLILSSIILLFGCTAQPLEEIYHVKNEQDDLKELILSSTDNGDQEVVTDQLTYALEVLEGNGDYTASISEFDGDPDAKVTFDRNRITVDILSLRSVLVTITDKKKQKASFRVRSTHPSLHVPNFNTHVEIGDSIIRNDVQFGAGGPYTLTHIRGDAADAVMVNNGIKVVGKKYGNTYYKIADKRGTVTRFDVINPLNISLTDDFLRLELNNTMTTWINLGGLGGVGWIIDNSFGAVIQNLRIIRLIDSSTLQPVDYESLYIETSDHAKGMETIYLKHESGKTAVIQVQIK